MVVCNSVTSKGQSLTKKNVNWQEGVGKERAATVPTRNSTVRSWKTMLGRHNFPSWVSVSFQGRFCCMLNFPVGAYFLLRPHRNRCLTPRQLHRVWPPWQDAKDDGVDPATSETSSSRRKKPMLRRSSSTFWLTNLPVMAKLTGPSGLFGSLGKRICFQTKKMQEIQVHSPLKVTVCHWK